MSAWYGALEAEIQQLETRDLAPVEAVSVQPGLLPLVSLAMEKRGYELVTIGTSAVNPFQYGFGFRDSSPDIVILHSVWKRKAVSIAASERTP